MLIYFAWRLFGLDSLLEAIPPSLEELIYSISHFIKCCWKNERGTRRRIFGVGVGVGVGVDSLNE